jgi:hypothetical protein
VLDDLMRVGGIARFSVSLAAACVALLGPAQAGAQAQPDDASRAAGRDIGTAGVDAFQRGDFVAASSELEKAYSVLKVPSVGLWSARALAKLGQLVKASERYREVTLLEPTEGSVAIQKQAQQDAATELSALTARIPSIVIQVEGGSAALALSVDGVNVSTALLGVPRLVDPGKHVVQARDGARQTSAEITLAEGESKPLALSFQSAGSVANPGPAPAPSGPPADTSNHPGFGTQKTVALVAGGVGVVGVVLGTVFGLESKSKHDDADKYCTGSACTDARGVTLKSDARSAGNVSTAMMIVGGVGLASGVTLWLTAPKASSSAQVGVGLGSLRLSGAF